MWRGFGGPEVVHCSGWGITGMIIMCVFWALVIAAVVWGLMRMKKCGYMMHRMRGDNALDIARERYAKSEINQEEFEKIKKNLS